MDDYDGFTNFDTYEAFMIICDELHMKAELELAAQDSNIKHFRMMVVAALQTIYQRNNFQSSIQADPNLINYVELKRAFAHAD